MNCERCDIQIPAKRLVAIPNARYCVSCQERIGTDEAPVSDNVLACGGESDDNVRAREWEPTRQARSVSHHRAYRGLLHVS